MSGIRSAEVPKLRHQTVCFLVGQPASVILERRLLTGRSLPQCLIHVYDESNGRHTVIKETVECEMRIWAKSGMKTQLCRSCIRNLEKLWIQWKDINKQKTGKDDEKVSRVFKEDGQPMGQRSRG